MIKWLHELFNPHCEHCAQLRREEREEQKQLREEAKYCSSCESMERENSRLVRENERLLNLLLEKPEPVVEKAIDTRDLKPIQTTRTPFVPMAVRRQILEQESRAAAKIQREAPKPDSKINKDVEMEALERELDSARQTRENEAAS